MLKLIISPLEMPFTDIMTIVNNLCSSIMPRLGIATNDSEAGARATAEALGLTALFSVIIGYDSVARAKPHADQLELFAAKTGIPASAIAMVGDNGHDLEMAHAAGAGLAVGVLSGNSTLDDLASLSDAILGSIADLPDFLAGRAKALRT